MFRIFMVLIQTLTKGEAGYWLTKEIIYEAEASGNTSAGAIGAVGSMLFSIPSADMTSPNQMVRYLP